MGLTAKDKRAIIYKGVFIFILAFVVWLTSTCEGTNNSAKSSVHPSMLKLGVEVYGNNFGIDSNGLLRGKQYELVQSLLLDDFLLWVPFNSQSEAIKALQNGDIDLYVGAYPTALSDELKGVVLTEWVYHESYSLLARKEQSNSWEDCFQQDTLSVEVYFPEEFPMAGILLFNLAELSYPAIEPISAKLTPTQLAFQLHNKHVEYVMLPKEIAHSIQKVDSTLYSIDHLSFALEHAWLVNKENKALKQQLDSTIVAYRNRNNK